jgi:probable F420-dependent oxidoreductase
MIRNRPFRFGILAGGASSKKEWVDKVRKAENSGYSLVLMPDHVSSPFSAFAAMVTAAHATTSLRVGSYVLGNDFRNPLALARETVTVDILTEGRLELGLGTGWNKSDYTQMGIPFDAPGVRVSRLEEALKILQKFYAGSPFTFQGKFYNLEVTDISAAPVQKPGPPLIIGGGGKRILSLAAREADIVSINPKTTTDGWLDFSSFSPQAAAQKVEWICEAAGDRIDKLEISTIVPVCKVTNSQSETIKEIESLRNTYQLTDEVLTVEQVFESPHFYYGSEESIIEKMLAVRERFGISNFVFFEPLEASAGVVRGLAGHM